MPTVSNFGARALATLNVAAEVPQEDLDCIPSEGPLLVVANHPLGAIDGLLLIDAISTVRSDLKLLGNHLLRYLPALQPSLIPIDVLTGRRSVPRNASSLRHAIRWLNGRGCLLVFPAGEVAHLHSNGHTVDSPWQQTAAGLACKTGACVLPVFIDGENSRLFRAAGRIHPLLRTALLPREMWAARGRTFRVRIGQPVRPNELAALPNARARTDVLRARVDALGARLHGGVAKARHDVEPIAPRGDADCIRADIDALQSKVLLESGPYQVFCASSPVLPAVLPEIGRLREMTFRHAGEGTGRSRDLDRFDATYEHLFVWDRQRQEIAGAYRLGATDVVARGRCVEGLYTRTLFDYDARLLDELGPALELGRAFVQPDYQREFSPLLLLWRGISRVVVQSGRYRRLFGVVSISDRYQTVSRQLMVNLLQTCRFDSDLAGLVRAKNPPPPARSGLVENTTVSSLGEVSSLIRRIEPDGKDIPVLLRQYLKLNAKLLGFSVDAAFGDVLDGLVVVDLADVEPAILSRYMGRTDAANFLGVRLKPDTTSVLR